MKFDAVLKCYAPNNGPLLAQIFLTEDRGVIIEGDASIARQRFVQLLRGGAGIPVPEPAPKPPPAGVHLTAGILQPKRRGRPRKFHEAEYVGSLF